MRKNTLTILTLACFVGLSGCASKPKFPSFSWRKDQPATQTEEATQSVNDTQAQQAKETTEPSSNHNKTYTYRFPHLIIR